MPRLPRFALPGIPQHVVQRGNNRQACFRTEQDYRFYLKCLHDASKRYGCAVHAYVLMTNHAHLLVTPKTAQGIPRFMQHIGRRYVQYFNLRYRRTGTLWEGRYKASLIDGEAYLLTCYRYIEMNPVRAALVDQPSRYRWSSYHHNALGKVDKVIMPHELYMALGAKHIDRCMAYNALFREFSETTLNIIRESLNQEIALGNDQFRAEVERALGRRARPKRRGRPSKRPEQQAEINV